MPPPGDLSTKAVDAQSSIANYINNIDEIKYRDEEKLYIKREPSLAKAKPWPEFLRLAISRQCLEGRSRNAKVEVYDVEDELLLSTGKRRKNFMGFDKAEDPRLARAIADLDERARAYAEDRHRNTKSSRRPSHHERVEENAPRGRSNRGESIKVESHHVRRHHDSGDQDAEPRRRAQLHITAPPRRSQMSLNYEDGKGRTSLHGRSNGQAPPQEYVLPARPPIVITLPSQPSEPRRQGYQPSPQHEDYQPLPQRPAQPRSHLSSAHASMSGGLRPPAPSPPSRSEFDSHRADRPPTRRESASRSGHGYSNSPSDRHSQGRDSVHGSLRNDYSQARTSVHGSRRDDYSQAGGSVREFRNSRTKRWVDGSANGESRGGRERSRQSEVGCRSIRSRSNTYSDESWGSEATVGVPNWGSGAGESRTSNRREGRVSDRHTSRALDGREGRMLERSDSRGRGRSESGP